MRSASGSVWGLSDESEASSTDELKAQALLARESDPAHSLAAAMTPDLAFTTLRVGP